MSTQTLTDRADLLPLIQALSGVKIGQGAVGSSVFGENQQDGGPIYTPWSGMSGGTRLSSDIGSFFGGGNAFLSAPKSWVDTTTGWGENINPSGHWSIDQGAADAALAAHNKLIAQQNGLDPNKQYVVGRDPASGEWGARNVLYELDANGNAKPVRAQDVISDGGWMDKVGKVVQTAVPLFLGAVAGGAALTGAGALGGAGSGSVTGGSGLTVGGAPSGAGLVASPGSGLTLAGATGTGSGLAAGTGANIIGAGIGASLPAVGASALTSGSSGSSLLDSLRTYYNAAKTAKTASDVLGGGGGGGSGNNAGGGDMANAITDWLSQFASGAAGSLGAAAGKIDPLQLAFANYQMQGAERDRDAASSKANEFADFLKTQITRTTDLGDKLQGSLDAQLGKDNSQQLIDSLKTLGDAHEARSSTEYGKLQDTLDQAGDRMDSLFGSLGPARTFGEADVNSLTDDIYNKKVGAVDRSLRLASSQGFADALGRGLTDSTQAADTRDNVARRFADTFAGLDADSRAQATNQIGQLSTLQSSQRGARLDELTKALNPELQGRIAAFHPDNTALQASQVAAGIDTNKLGSILQALTRTNDSATNAAGGLAKGSADAFAAALSGLGQSRARMVEALRPAAQTIINNGATRASGTTDGSTTAGGVGSIVSGIPAAADWLSDWYSRVTAGGDPGIDLSGAGLGTDGALLGSLGNWFDTTDLGSDWSDAFSGWFQ